MSLLARVGRSDERRLATRLRFSHLPVELVNAETLHQRDREFASSVRTASETLLDRQRVLAFMWPIGILAGDISGPARHFRRLLRV